MSEKYNIPVLEEKYLKAKISYYEGKPDLTDPEFDALEKILKEVGSKVVEQVGSKRKDFDFYHPTKMLSLDKIQTEETPEGINYMEEDFMKWYQKRKAIIGTGVALLGSPKFDGNAINIIYRGGKLANIVTRSDAYTGKDITKRFLKKVPNYIDLMAITFSEDDVVEIRCEVVIKTKIFNEKYAEDFANPRNYVAGVIGADDEDEVKIEELDIIPLHYILNGKQISQRGFIKNPLYNHSFNLSFLAENYIETIKSYENLRKNFPYQLDGVVITFPTEYRDLLGENDHDPEWGIAIKFIPIEAITEVEGIEWNVGKRGELVPTVLLKAVLLDGSTIRRASGYNARYIIDNGLRPGSMVSIHKSGDIIPEISKVIIA